MRYVNQLQHPHLLYVTRTTLDEENREYGRTTTVKSSGCGLCAAIMALDRLLTDYKFDLPDAIQLAYDVKANLRVGTDYAAFAPAVAERFGLRLETATDVEAVRRCLRTGGVAVVLVGGDRDDHVGLFCKGGHYMTIISEEPDGRLAILDPAYSVERFKRDGREEARSGKVEIKNEIITICAADVLHEETRGKKVPYYLFWRG